MICEKPEGHETPGGDRLRICCAFYYFYAYAGSKRGRVIRCGSSAIVIRWQVVVAREQGASTYDISVGV